MSDQQFTVGDVVTQTGSTVPMTVEHVTKDRVNCVWFEGKTRKRGGFDPKTLTVVTENQD
jgi:uncharacterized protein YodC (DUF2158 family)